MRLARRPPSHRLQAIRRYFHERVSNSGMLLRSYNPSNLRQTKKRAWPFGSYSLHNVPTIRAISFARVLPNLAIKLVRIPAMFGTAMIAGLAYLQYQTIRKLFVILDVAEELTAGAHRGRQLCHGYFQKG